MKRIRFVTTVTLTLLISLIAAFASVHAFSETRDPFVAAPMGPYALLNNPASAMDTKALTVRAAFGQGMIGGDATQLLAYLEPDMGLGAGALSWHGTNLANGSKRREIAYTVARQVNKSLYYGLTLKHVNEDAAGAWAADLGLMTTDLSRLRAGLVVHNMLGASTINPTHVTGSLSYDLMNTVAIAASVSAPTLADTSQMEVGVALDVPFSTGSRLRLGRVTNVTSLDGYWLGSVSVDLNSIVLDTTILLDQGTNRRVAIGVVYRF